MRKGSLRRIERLLLALKVELSTDSLSLFLRFLRCCAIGVSESVESRDVGCCGPLALRSADRSMFTDDSRFLFSVALSWLERGVGL